MSLGSHSEDSRVRTWLTTSLRNSTDMKILRRLYWAALASDFSRNSRRDRAKELGGEEEAKP